MYKLDRHSTEHREAFLFWLPLCTDQCVPVHHSECDEAWKALQEARQWCPQCLVDHPHLLQSRQAN